MSIRRRSLPILVLAIGGIAAACQPAAPGSPAASAPASADPSAATSAEPSAAASASASASAEASPSGGGDVTGLIPEAVGDIQLSVVAGNPESYAVANVNRQLGPILEAAGATASDLAIATSTGSSAGGATLFVDAVQIPGADATALLTAFQTAASLVPGATVEGSEVDGRSVVTVTTGSYTLAAVANGDAIVYVQSPDAAIVEQAIAALP